MTITQYIYDRDTVPCDGGCGRRLWPEEVKRVKARTPDGVRVDDLEFCTDCYLEHMAYQGGES